MNPEQACAPRRMGRFWACCLCAALTLVAALAVFHSLLTPPLWPKLLLTGDYHWYHGPQAFNLDAALHDGEFPLWNPLTLCGQPFAHNPQISVFYPPNLVRSLLNFHPTPEKTHLGLMALVLLHLIIAALGTYALSRDYGLSRGASAVAVLAYVFGPTFVRRVLLQWVLVASAAWLPWQILLLRRAIRADNLRGRLFYGLAGALVFAMNILSGFPQLTFCTAILMGLFFLFEQLFHLKRADLRAPAAALRRFAGSSASSALLFVVAALLAAAVLVPGAEYGGYGGRARGQGFEVQAAGQDLSPGHILRSLIVYPGATDAEQGARGAGLFVIVLAAAAFTHTRRREVFLFAALFYQMTECTLGPPFPFGWLVSRMDLLQFSSPWRAGILTGLPLAMLAAFGADAVTERFHTWPRGIARALLLLVAGVVPAWFLLRWLNASPYVQPGSAAVYIPMAGLAVAMLAGFIRLPRLWRTMLIGLLFAEILVWNNAFIPRFLARQSYGTDAAFLHQHPTFWQDNYRGGDPEPNMDLYRLKPAMNGYDPMRIERVRQLVCDPKKAGFYYRFIKDWETTSENQRGNLLLKRSFWLARQYARGPLPGKEELFPPTTTVFFPEAVPKTTLPEVPRASVIGHAVSDQTKKIPLLNAQYFAALTQALGRDRMRVTLPAFKLGHAHGVLCIRYRSRQSASDVAVSFTEPATGSVQHGKHVRMRATGDGSDVLEIPVPAFGTAQASLTYTKPAVGPGPELEEAWLTLDSADEDEAITVLSRRRNDVEVELKDLPGERILLFVDSWYPGWSATVNGKSTPIFLADDAFKAVVVPAGTHRVRFAFSSPAVYLGVFLSLVTLLLTALALYALRGRSKEYADLAENGRVAFAWVVAGFPCWFPVRVVVRLTLALAWILTCYLASLGVGAVLFAVKPLRQAALKRVSRAWLHGMRAIFGIRLFWIGQPPAKPYFLVSNHLSWQDFFALACSCDAPFVVQAADETLPIVGRLMTGLDVIHCPPPGGDATKCVKEMIAALRAGKSLIMAPEGIVGPGREVRTFHPDLLEAAVQAPCPVHYVSITFRTPPGCPSPSKVALFGPDPMFRTPDGRIPESELEAWGPERPFFPHLLGVLALPWHDIILHFGDAPITGDNRAILATALHDAVQDIFTPVP